MREWDRGKTRMEDDLDAPVRLGGPAAPAFVAARDARSQLPPPPAGASPAPRSATEKPAADPAARRLERWRRDSEREDRDARDRDDARFRERERRWERDEADRFRARARRKAREADAARARARDVREDLEPDEDERAAEARLAKESAEKPGHATPVSRRRLLDALVAAGPPGWFLDARDVARRRRYREREREEEARDERKLAELEARGDAERTKRGGDAAAPERDAAPAPAPAPEPSRQGTSEPEPERSRDARAEALASSAPAPSLVAPSAAPAAATILRSSPTKRAAPPARLKTKIAVSSRKLASALPASSAFGEEDEEEVKVERRLVPIEYTPEELAAASAPASTAAEEERREAIREGEAAAAEARAAAAAAAKAAAKAAAAVTAKRLKPAVEWTAYVTRDAVARNVTAWVREKVRALLGEDEPSLVEFVGDALASKPAAAAALAALLEPMLGDETGPFVDELWRVLARETTTRPDASDEAAHPSNATDA